MLPEPSVVLYLAENFNEEAVYLWNFYIHSIAATSPETVEQEKMLDFLEHIYRKKKITQDVGRVLEGSLSHNNVSSNVLYKHFQELKIYVSTPIPRNICQTLSL